MIFIIIDGRFKPSHYNSFDNIIISADHVARFFGCQLVCAIKGLPSIDEYWSTREALDAVGTAKESMPHSAFSDMQRCMHFADDWVENEGEVWNDYYSNEKVDLPTEVAHHRRKFAC
jgi:hypothetical protein